MNKRILQNKEDNIFDIADKLFADTFLGKHPFWEFYYTDPTGYPYYNVIQNGSNYTVELAAAGFSKEDIKVYIENSTLFIEGSREVKSKENDIYLHQGISRKWFKRTWKLSNETKIVEATYKDGIVRVYLTEEKRKAEVNIVELK